MLELHKAHRTICEYASEALFYLACVDSLRASIVGAGAVHALVAVCRVHEGVVAPRWSHNALNMLGYNDDGSESKPQKSNLSSQILLVFVIKESNSFLSLSLVSLRSVIMCT